MHSVVDCTVAGYKLKRVQPATNEPGISLLTAAYCSVPCFLVQCVLVRCLQIMIEVKDLRISAAPGEFDEDVLAGWVCVLLAPLIYGDAYALVSQPNGCCRQK